MSRNAFAQIESETNEAEGMREHAAMERRELHAMRKYPAPCAGSCEAVAFQIEIRQITRIKDEYRAELVHVKRQRDELLCALKIICEWAEKDYAGSSLDDIEKLASKAMALVKEGA
jgi:hypothetical protein